MNTTAIHRSTYSCLERTYRGCAPLPSITAPNIRDDGNKNLVDNYPRLTSIEKALRERQHAQA